MLVLSVTLSILGLLCDGIAGLIPLPKISSPMKSLFSTCWSFMDSR